MNIKLFDVEESYKRWGDYEEIHLRLEMLEQKVLSLKKGVLTQGDKFTQGDEFSQGDKFTKDD
jgi:hypothetical protein